MKNNFFTTSLLSQLHFRVIRFIDNSRKVLTFVINYLDFITCFNLILIVDLRFYSYIIIGRKERCPRGRRSTTGNRVCAKPAPWVQIPLSPPVCFSAAWVRPFAAEGCEPRQVRKEAAVSVFSGCRR